MEYIVVIIISSLCLVALVVLIVVLAKRKPVNNNSTESLLEIGGISKQLETLSSDIQKDMQTALSQEMIKVIEKEAHNSEVNNEKLERFQKSINESLNVRFDAFNSQMNERLEAINKKVDEKLAEGFKGTSESMAQVRERLQAIDTAQKNIESLSKDVVSLKTVLEGNQSRGKYGEYQLSMVLHNVFGDTIGCYEEQYTMHKTKDGDDVRADAVVFMPEPNKMICIDSKFPFSTYNQLFDTSDESLKQEIEKAFSADVKKHITDIKNKYIIEGKTSQNAIMFIPNDGVFAYIYQHCDLVVEYARESKVILTSPSTLPSILVTINMVRIESERAKNVQEISKQLSSLGKQFELFAKEWDSFSKQLETATRSREKLDSRVNRITGKFDSIKGNEIEENNVIEELPFDDNEND